LLCRLSVPPVRSASTTPSTADLPANCYRPLRPAIPAAPYRAGDSFRDDSRPCPWSPMFRGSLDLGDASNDVTKLPLRRRLVLTRSICLHVLEHVEDDLSAMREFRRVLTPEGLAVLQVPIGGDTTIEDPVTDPRERLKRYGQEDHVPSTEETSRRGCQCRLPCDSSRIRPMSSLRPIA